MDAPAPLPAAPARALVLAARLSVLRNPVRLAKICDPGALASPGPVAPEILKAVAEVLAGRGLTAWIPGPMTGTCVFPALLLVAGTPPAAPGVAIVGARASDAYGLECAAQCARDAVSMGRVVISGGAEGCDAAAHEAAMAAGGKTVVVLGAGHDHPYPAHHRDLFARVVASGGALVSAWWPDTRPAKHQFLTRNRIIAALSAVTVVARASARSGALSTARAALALSRPVLAFPGDIGDGLSAGAHRLLDGGLARPLVGSETLARALDMASFTPKAWPVRHGGQGAPWPVVGSDAGADPGFAADSLAALKNLPKEARSVLDTMAKGVSLDLDHVVMQTGLAVAITASILLDLELAGLVERRPGMRFAACSAV